MPTGPPVAALQKHGLHMPVTELNDRVHNIVQAHELRFGVKPTPGLVFDLVRAPVELDGYDRLLDLPRTKRQARSRAALASAGLIAHPEEGALAAEQGQPFVYGLPDEADLETARNFPNLPRDQQLAFLRSMEGRSITEKQQLLQAAGRLPMPEGHTNVVLAGTGAEVVFEFGFKFFTQVFGGLTLGPALLGFSETKGVYESVRARSARPLYKANEELVRGAVQGYKDTYANGLHGLAENPGYVFLDLMGFGAVVGGLGAKVAKGTLRPRPGRTTVSLGGVERDVLLSPNAAVRPAQRWNLARREEAAANRLAGEGKTPDVWASSMTGRFFRRNLSFERKIGRLRERSRRIDLAIETQIVRDLERVAGWAQAAATAGRKLPLVARKGLTVGENMALFIESLDIAGTTADRVAALRDHHYRMMLHGPEAFEDVLGVRITPEAWVAEHTARVSAIKLADTVLRNPEVWRPRFRQAMTLVREAVRQQEDIRINELGLSPITARGRVAKAGAVVRGDELAALPEGGLGVLQRDERGAAIDVAPLEKVREESHYVPSVSRKRTRKTPKSAFRGPRLGDYGIPLPRPLPELTHEFRGNHFIIGDYRFDVANLLSESLGKTIRAAIYKRDHDELWQHALDKPPRGEADFYAPIRDIHDIPQSLRETLSPVDLGEFTRAEADALGSSKDIAGMLEFLYPGKYNRRTRTWESLPENANVRWIDQRLLPVEAYTQPLPSWALGFFHVVNAPLSLARVFWRPAYALNLVGNVGLGLVDGSFKIPNVARALHSRGLYGDRVADAMEALVGTGRSMSYAVEGQNVLSRVSRVTGHVWGRITDRDLRVAAFIEHARRLEYGTPADMERLLFSKDKKTVGDRNEARQRAVQAMVEFDNMTWVEKNSLKQIIFVYPWTSRSTVWSIRSIIDHPVKADILAHFGGAVDDDDNFMKMAADWMKRAGWLPFYTNDKGQPVVGGFAFANPYSGIGEILNGDVEHFLGPTGELFIRAATGRDEFGNEYPAEGAFAEYVKRLKAVADVYAQIPVVQAWVRGHKEDAELPDIDIRDLDQPGSSLIRRLNAAMGQAILSPGYWNGWGVLFSGSATPRAVNELALKSRWYRALPLEDKHNVEMGLLRYGLKMQADFLGRDRVPADVSLAVERKAEISLRERKWSEAHPGELLPLRTRAEWDLEYLIAHDLVDEGEAAKLKKTMAGLVTDSEYERFRRGAFVKYAGGQSLADWDSDVRLAASIVNAPLLERNVKGLGQDGLLTSESRSVAGVKRADLLAYARRVVAYSHEANRRDDALREVTDPYERPVAFAELRDWENAQDHPVSVGGRRLPSPVRLAWAYQTDGERDYELVRNVARRPWSFLSTFDKLVLGKKVEPQVAKGWTTLAGYIADYKTAHAAGERNLPDGYEAVLAKHVDKYTAPGFYKDWLFSREPLARRLQVLRIRASSDFKSVIDAGATYAGYLKNDGYSKQAVRDSWHDYVKATVEPYVQSHPRLEAELARYGPTVLYDLLD